MGPREEPQDGAAVGAPQSLPDPVIDPADLEAIMPGLTPEEASLYCSLATLALEAVCWPMPIPAAPLPAPLELAGLSIATRLAAAGEAAGEGGAVVSESIGSYTYRLATPLALDQALSLTDAERDLLRPWAGQTGVYDLSVLGPTLDWPLGWWQADYDRLEVTP